MYSSESQAATAIRDWPLNPRGRGEPRKPARRRESLDHHLKLVCKKARNVNKHMTACKFSCLVQSNSNQYSGLLTWQLSTVNMCYSSFQLQENFMLSHIPLVILYRSTFPLSLLLWTGLIENCFFWKARSQPAMFCFHCAMNKLCIRPYIGTVFSESKNCVWWETGYISQLWLYLASVVHDCKYSQGIMLPTIDQVVLDISIGSHFLSLEAESTMASCETIP